MRKKYIILVTVIIIEFEIISALNKLGKSAETFLGNLIGLVVFLTPVLILLNSISNDDNIKESIKVISKFVFWFIIICFIAGVAAELIGKI